MPSVEELQKSVQEMLDSFGPFIEESRDIEWNISDGFLPVIYRSILTRQFDHLGTISYLVAQERGYAAPPLLRPSCEELIWIKYLTSIETGDAEELLQCRAGTELFESLKAQDVYGGRSVTKELGLLPAFKRANESQGQIRHRLSALGKKLNWDNNVVKGGRIPSTKWFARKTEQIKLYNFIYHASSRFVHFSTAELFRRSWGEPGKISIRPIHFRDYWGSFSLYWGLRLFLDTAIEICSVLGMPSGEMDGERFLAAAQRVGEFGQVPIITAEELAWPE